MSVLLWQGTSQGNLERDGQCGARHRMGKAWTWTGTGRDKREARRNPGPGAAEFRRIGRIAIASAGAGA